MSAARTATGYTLDLEQWMSLRTYHAHRRRRMVGRISLAAAIVVVGSAAVAADPLDVGSDGSDGEPPAPAPIINPPQRVVPELSGAMTVEDVIAELPARSRAEDAPADAAEDASDEAPEEAPEHAHDEAPEATPTPDEATAPRSAVWDDLAACESNGNWSINTGNGYYGGLQFNLDSWVWAGGEQYASYPHEAGRGEQIAIAERLLEIHPAGWGAWPACSRQLGLS